MKISSLAGFVALLTLALTANAVEKKDIQGQWVGTFSGDPARLTLESDGSYEHSWEVFGTTIITKGKWHIEEGALVLDREIEIAKGEERQVPERQVHIIEEASGETLRTKYKHKFMYQKGIYDRKK